MYSLEELEQIINMASGKDVDLHLHLYQTGAIVIPGNGNGDPGNGDEQPPISGTIRYIRENGTLIYTPDTRQQYGQQPPGYNKNGNPILTPQPIGAAGDDRWKVDKNDRVIVGDSEMASGGVHVRRWKEKSGAAGEVLFFMNDDLSAKEVS